MLFARRLSSHERAVVQRLRLLGQDGERTIGARPQFRDDLRDRLVAEASDHGCCGEQGRALAGC